MTLPSARRRLAVTGAGVWRNRHLAALLDDHELLRADFPRAFPPADAVLAWGQRPSAAHARALAARHRLPLLCIEDGFLRSVGLGADEPPLSIVVDDLGIYFDASRESRLEALVRAGVTAAQAARALALREAWCAARVSKYNHLREKAVSLPEDFVLVVDQTAGDASIAGGLADARSFVRMLEAALAEHPASTVLLKTHPDVVAGRKRGCFDMAWVAQQARVQVLAEGVHPVPLLARARAVYTVTSQLGFEALLHGRPVRTFGMPFYAGWGLTDDALPPPSRRAPVTLAALVHAALVAYPRYLDPETGARCEPEVLLDWMALQRRQRARLPEQLVAHGFSPAKRPALHRFTAGSDLLSRMTPARARAQAGHLHWGYVAAASLAPGAGRWCVEDGFLRSVGLGAELVQPLSWVFDDVGIYYDATRPSRLETLLQQAPFDPALCARAAALRAAIVDAGITKYNVAGASWRRPQTDRRVILVPGQVESDASIRFGAPAEKTNLGLLRAVRRECPDAWLVYKPHPDVVAGVRKPGRDEHRAGDLCDEVVTDAPMHTLIAAVDEVHVLTSLAGFEALLRGKPVTCWGQPFYAGWGLTRDRVPVSRRTRQVTLDELVAATLILYPVYVSRRSGTYTTPERALAELQAWRDEMPAGGWRRALARHFMRWRARWL